VLWRSAQYWDSCSSCDPRAWLQLGWCFVTAGDAAVLLLCCVVRRHRTCIEPVVSLLLLLLRSLLFKSRTEPYAAVLRCPAAACNLCVQGSQDMAGCISDREPRVAVGVFFCVQSCVHEFNLRFQLRPLLQICCSGAVVQRGC
jgi:hypothetical protein